MAVYLKELKRSCFNKNCDTMNAKDAEDAASRLGLHVVEKQLKEDEQKENVKLDEWRKWLQFEDHPGDSDLVAMDKACKELAKGWEQFQSVLPKAKRTAAIERSIPEPSSIWTEVETAQQEWERKKDSRFGQAKANFSSFCQTLDEHSYLFSILPNGDKYTCLFTGVISSIVKVTVAHEAIANGFSRALVEISSDLSFSRKQSHIIPTSEIKILVVGLYIQIFQFLGHAMKWYQSWKSRFKAMLNRDFYDTNIEAKVASIKGLVTRIRQEAGLECQKDIKKIAADVAELLHAENHRVADQWANSEVNVTAKLSQMIDEKFEKLLTVGHSSKSLFIAMGQNIILAQGAQMTESNSFQTSKFIPIEPDRETSVAGNDLSGQSNTYTRQEMERDSLDLEAYVEDASVDIAHCMTRSTVPAAREIFNPIQKWIKATDSRMLWVEGAANFAPVSDISIAAAHIQALVRQSEIPCIAFFCKIRHRDPAKDDPLRTRQSDGLVALLYSLIRQLVSLAPSTIQDEKQFRSLFPLLDGKIGSVPIAMDMIKGLLDIAPKFLVCFIDGIQLLDHKDTNAYVEELIGILRIQDLKRAVKVLFTTSGSYPTLRRILPPGEAVRAGRRPRPGERVMVGSQPWQKLKG
ncbi:hypothetical protein GJ744_005285 [Endocarpon pusillum]|uniref:DUF7708 domain-containing protein n=1 Tax=Endocarpon pusillum TaxID=364733 RepID=A0A8H7A8M6_9EURO|nr:hypothetical protein GJ744_005285 [Endocarpon pusillum]